MAEEMSALPAVAIKATVKETMGDPSEKLSSILAECTEGASPDHQPLMERGAEAIKSSSLELTQLKDDGCDLIGSLQCATAVRTLRNLTKRKETEAVCNNLASETQQRLTKTDGQLKERWLSASKVTAPHLLVDDIAELKETSESMLSAQQELITRLREEVDRAELGIQSEIERQTDDLGVMLKRTKEHLDSTRVSQRCQLQQIDEAMGEDYAQLLEQHGSQLDRLLLEWSTTESEILGELTLLGDRWDEDLDTTDKQYHSLSHYARHSLTDDIQLIESELEQLKANFLLNNEVLDYNCRVLKMREEERVALAQRQKRRIDRLTERCRKLRDELDQSAYIRRRDELKLVKENQQLRQDCDNMERKFRTIKTSNDHQLEAVSLMAETRITELLKKLAKMDERIFVEILEQTWDGQVGKVDVSGSVSPLGSGELQQVVKHLERNLQFLLVAKEGEASETNEQQLPIEERLMKALDLTDQQEFQTLLTRLDPTGRPSEMLRELAFQIKQQKEQSVDPVVSARPYLIDAEHIRAHFAFLRETAVPRHRLDLWKMLARALVQYERILRDRLTLAAEILTQKKQAKKKVNIKHDDDDDKSTGQDNR